MDIIDIQEWADDEIRVVEISHLFNYSSLKAKMRRFVPREGDTIDESWTDRQGVMKTHEMPPYAIVDMNEHVEVVRNFVERNVAEYISALVGQSETLLWNTYLQAFRHMGTARVCSASNGSFGCVLIFH